MTPETMTREQAADFIAKTLLGIETLETRHRDSADFHDLAIWKIRAALSAAYDLGVLAGFLNCAQELAQAPDEGGEA